MNGWTSIIVIFIAVGLAYLPNIAGLYASILSDFSFQGVDFVLIMLSLWEIAVRVLFSMDRQEGKVEIVLGWLDRIDDAACKGIWIQAAVMVIPGMVLANVVKVLGLRDTLVGLSFLALGYISIALIRLFTIDSERGFVSIRDSILRKLLERDIDLYAERMGIREKEASSVEEEKDR